jgi:hypothetical protein
MNYQKEKKPVKPCKESFDDIALKRKDIAIKIRSRLEVFEKEIHCN